MEKPSLSLKDIGRIYLDYNATTPPHPEVLARLPEWAESWGNPSSIHWLGRGPKNLIRESRSAIAELIEAHPLEIIFTSGGSEANNHVIKGVFALNHGGARNEYITSSVEHPSVMKSFEAIKKQGAVVHVVNVDRNGRLDIDQYLSLLSEKTALVSIMAANNETGTRFPISALTEKAHGVGAQFHSDCVQILGKEIVSVKELGVDYATFAGHKFYSLKGVGVLFVKKGQRLESLIAGGGQERSRRAGTENILAITSLGYMARQYKALVIEKAQHMRALREHLEATVLSQISGVTLTGAGSPRLPNTSSFVIENIDGESLLINLDVAGVSVSTGAACSSGSPEPSPVLLAMGLTRFEAQSSLRVSLGWLTTEVEVNTFVKSLKEVVSRLREFRDVAQGVK